MTTSLKLTRLLNADGETVGYFSDHVAEMAARKEWDDHYAQLRAKRAGMSDAEIAKSKDWIRQISPPRCRSIETPIAPAKLEDVEPGDGDRGDYVWDHRDSSAGETVRILNRRPGKSSRDVDLGGPVEAAGVLYVLRVKAPK